GSGGAPGGGAGGARREGRHVLDGVSALALAFLMAAAARATDPADLVLLSARIWTGDPARPSAEALAVRRGRIVAVGKNFDIEAFRGPATRVLDSRGRRVVPGFIDAP